MVQKCWIAIGLDGQTQPISDDCGWQSLHRFGDARIPHA